MVGGMATIAGGVLAAYVGFLGGTDPIQQQIYATHLLSCFDHGRSCCHCCFQNAHTRRQNLNTLTQKCGYSD
jgi:hypothetical protein